MVEPFSPGMLILLSFAASGPASRTRIQSDGNAWLSNEATAIPAVPPPTMTCLNIRK